MSAVLGRGLLVGEGGWDWFSLEAVCFFLALLCLALLLRLFFATLDLQQFDLRFGCGSTMLLTTPTMRQNQPYPAARRGPKLTGPGV
jgi:hypothetical protein